MTDSKNLLLCLWPVCSSYEEAALSLLSKQGFILEDSRKLFLTFPQFNQFIYDTYKKEPWMSLAGHLRKATWCWQKDMPLTLLLVSGGSADALASLKEALRQEYGHKKHSFHSTENSEDTAFLWNSYTVLSPDFSYARSLSKNPLWFLFKWYYRLRVTILSLIGRIEA